MHMLTTTGMLAPVSTNPTPGVEVRPFPGRSTSSKRINLRRARPLEAELDPLQSAVATKVSNNYNNFW